MSRFEDQPSVTKQDQGYRSDEVKGPYREDWASSPAPTVPEKTDSIGGGSGLGDNKNPAWAGAQASLESDSAGRGLYGEGEEGASGYGKHQKADGHMPSSPTNAGATPVEPRAATKTEAKTDTNGASTSLNADVNAQDRDFGTRHWGHGEYKGDDSTPGSGDGRSTLERAVQTVGHFFGVGPKGYQRSDERLHEDVCEALKNHVEINASEIEVLIKQGKICLNGTVEDRQQRRLVEELLEKIPGIGEVENHLRTETYVARTEEADRLVTGEATVGPELHS